MAFKPVFESCNLQNLFAVFIQRREFHLAEEVFAAAFEPQEGFKAFAVEEGALFKVDDEIDDLAIVDSLFNEFAHGLDVLAGEVAVNRDHANVVVVFGFDGHGQGVRG